MPQVVKKAFVQAKVMCDRHAQAKVTSKSSFLAEEPQRRISKGYCRDIRPRSSLFVCILGLWPDLRMRVCSRKRYLRQKRLH